MPRALRIGAAAILCGSALAGCAELNPPPPETVPPPEPPSPLLRFVAEGAPGAQTTITDDGGAVQYVATIESAYQAASGRACKSLVLEPAGLGQGAPPPRRVQRIACFEQQQWHFVAPLQEDGGPSAKMLN